MHAGRMSYKVTVRRRAVIAGNPGGDARGDFADAFVTRAALKQRNGFSRAEAGLLENMNVAVLRVYSSAQNRTITIADRLRIEGPNLPAGEWAVDNVNLPDATRRHIEITVIQRIGG
jgi:head-tail adaptor